jgi:hypothetical protein
MKFTTFVLMVLLSATLAAQTTARSNLIAPIFFQMNSQSFGMFDLAVDLPPNKRWAHTIGLEWLKTREFLFDTDQWGAPAVSHQAMIVSQRWGITYQLKRHTGANKINTGFFHGPNLLAAYGFRHIPNDLSDRGKGRLLPGIGYK